MKKEKSQQSIPIRTEKDSLGSREIPADALYGIQTVRAAENFHISGVKMSRFPHVIRGLAVVKKASAIANRELDILEISICEAICRACDDLLGGKHHDQFIVDAIQGGAGTSTNMNANEVIANLALGYLGKKPGEYAFCHPNDHVNLSQSTNDVYPTAIRVGLLTKIDDLTVTMKRLKEAFELKEKEFANIIKLGRTQLQDAVPMTLGQEFGSYAVMIGEDIERVQETGPLLQEINMGATAIGTGINAPAGFSKRVEKYLREFTGLPLFTARNLVEATQDAGVFVQLSGVLKRFAVKLSKICNDLRLLSSGPRAGLNEINLPPVQPGSSIMPGKINPVIPEVVNQVCFQVMGNDVTITMAAEAGQLELNVMEPVIVFNMFLNITILTRACRTLKDRCVTGITANRDTCRNYVERSIGLATALNPVVGYENASEIAKEALRTGKSVYDLVLEKNLFTKEELDDLLKPERMTTPRLPRRS
jgi:aspartate ammonia-lyase